MPTKKCKHLREKCTVVDLDECPKKRMKGIASDFCRKIKIAEGNQ